MAHAKEKVTNYPKKQHTKSEGQGLPLKKCTVFLFYMLCRPRNKQVVFLTFISGIYYYLLYRTHIAQLL